MLVHLLALLDILSAGFLVLGHFHLIRIPLLYVAIYLITKLFFFRDWLSFIDAAAAIYAVFLFFGFASGLTWLFVFYFAYKTAVWLFFTLGN